MKIAILLYTTLFGHKKGFLMGFPVLGQQNGLCHFWRKLLLFQIRDCQNETVVQSPIGVHRKYL